MYSLQDAFAYYWRVFSNFEFGAIGVFGFLHSISFFGLLTCVMLTGLSILIFKANPQKNKNRFMAMMLLVEGGNAGILTLFWLYPWPPEAIPYLFPFRGMVLIFTIIRTFLYLSAPIFYLRGRWAGWIQKSFQSWNVLIYPIISVPLAFLFLQAYGGALSTAGDMVTIVCSKSGLGTGSNYSGTPLSFEPYCPETLSALYPLSFTTISTGNGTPFAIVLGAVTLLIATVSIAIISRRGTHFTADEKSEVHSIFLGFLVKTLTTYGGALSFVLAIMVFGAPDPSQNIFNEQWFDHQSTLLFFFLSPLTLLLHILAAFFEGVVFTYAVIKHEVMGIDEQLRKTFTATLFAGGGAVSLTVGSEMMEEMFGLGWVGGVVIGFLILVLSKPIFKAISGLSDALLPETHTKEEQGYLDLYSMATAEGDLSEKERAMLNRQAQTYGFSDKRIKHLEDWFEANRVSND